MNITSCHILLIEDNVLDADLIKRALQKVEAGIYLEIASDGEEAIEYLDKWQKGTPTPHRHPARPETSQNQWA